MCDIILQLLVLMRTTVTSYGKIMDVIQVGLLFYLEHLLPNNSGLSKTCLLYKSQFNSTTATTALPQEEMSVTRSYYGRSME